MLLSYMDLDYYILQWFLEIVFAIQVAPNPDPMHSFAPNQSRTWLQNCHFQFIQVFWWQCDEDPIRIRLVGDTKSEHLNCSSSPMESRMILKCTIIKTKAVKVFRFTKNSSVPNNFWCEVTFGATAPEVCHQMYGNCCIASFIIKTN